MPFAHNTVMDYAERWLQQCPDQVWLRERQGDVVAEWTWGTAYSEFQAVAAWLEAEYGDDGASVAILSKNRAHWMLADMAILSSGNVSIPLFTTLIPEIVDYVVNFSEVKLLVLGEAENWDKVRGVIPDDVKVLLLPGVEANVDATRWEDVVAQYQGRKPKHACTADEVFTIPFTSGTTGMPKGVLQTHDSMIIPMERSQSALNIRERPRFLSYLPLSHIAERQLVWINSLITCGEVSFNENLTTLLRDMAETRPTFFFGAPRVWEMLRQGITAKFGGQEALDQALAADRAGVQAKVQQALGFSDYDYLLTAAAPIPVALIKWYEDVRLTVTEGYGQTEAMVLVVNTEEHTRVGSIGKPVAGVEVRMSDEGEMLCKAEGLSPGYYKQPDKTAETFVDGWVHTGDKIRIDDDGFIFITGRVKDYFKTIQGKFVTPIPLEDAYAASKSVEQLCLLGRGYSKTVMVCVLSPAAAERDWAALSAELAAQAEAVNAEVEKHARIGAVIVAPQAWTIDNGMLTPTMKLKRNQVEEQFGAQAEALARQAAEQGQILVARAGQ